MSERSIYHEGKHLGSIRERGGKYLATLAGNFSPDWECDTYDKAVAVLMQWHACQGANE